MEKKSSFGARCVSKGMRALVVLSTKLTGESILRSSMYTQKPEYRFGSFKVPDGYTNQKISLKNANGYLLQKKGAEHEILIYQIHGGGFVSTFTNLYNRTALHFSKVCMDADVFSLDYRTAPKYVYPAALEDAIDGYEWILGQGYAPEQIYLCGESAGGGLCLALTLWLRDHGRPMPKGLMLSSPWTDLAAEGESYRTKKTEDHFFGYPDASKVPRYPVPIVYADQNELHDPYLSPAYGDYENFPAMLIQTGEAELLLSDSDTVVQKAKEKHVDVEYWTYPDMYHTFYITHPRLPESRIAWKRIEEWFGASENHKSNQCSSFLLQ